MTSLELLGFDNISEYVTWNDCPMISHTYFNGQRQGANKRTMGDR